MNLCCYITTRNTKTYVPHWHASTEIIMPVKGDYTIICNGTNYYLKERDILIIAPGTVHSIPACHGQRYIFLADFFHYIKSDCFSTIQAALSPVTLINGNTLPEIHDTCAQLISSCAEEYFGENRFRGDCGVSFPCSAFFAGWAHTV